MAGGRAGAGTCPAAAGAAPRLPGPAPGEQRAGTAAATAGTASHQCRGEKRQSRVCCCRAEVAKGLPFRCASSESSWVRLPPEAAEMRVMGGEKARLPVWEEILGSGSGQLNELRDDEVTLALGLCWRAVST